MREEGYNTIALLSPLTFIGHSFGGYIWLSTGVVGHAHRGTLSPTCWRMREKLEIIPFPSVLQEPIFGRKIKIYTSEILQTSNTLQSISIYTFLQIAYFPVSNGRVEAF